jgi:hypothetical protein
MLLDFLLLLFEYMIMIFYCYIILCYIYCDLLPCIKMFFKLLFIL